MCDYFRVGLGALFKAGLNSLRYEGNCLNSRLNKIHLLMYSFLLALIEKRRFCTSKQTLLSFFAFLAEILKYPLCTRCQRSQIRQISLNWYLTS